MDSPVTESELFDILLHRGKIVTCWVISYCTCLKAPMAFYIATPCHTIESVVFKYNSSQKWVRIIKSVKNFNEFNGQPHTYLVRNHRLLFRSSTRKKPHKTDRFPMNFIIPNLFPNMLITFNSSCISGPYGPRISTFFHNWMKVK